MKNFDEMYNAVKTGTDALKEFQEMASNLNRMKLPSEAGSSKKAAIAMCASLMGSLGAFVLTDMVIHEMTGAHIGPSVASAAENTVQQDNIPSLLANKSIGEVLADESVPAKISNMHMYPNDTVYFSGKNTIYKVDFVGMGADMEAKVTDMLFGENATAFLSKRGSYYDVEFGGNGSHRKVRISGHGFDGKPVKFAKISAYEVSNKGPDVHYLKTVKIHGNSTAWHKIKKDDRVEMGDYVIQYKGNYESGNKADKLSVTYNNKTATIELRGRDPAAYVCFEGSPYTLVIGGSGYKDKSDKRIFNLFAKLRGSHKFEDIQNSKEARRELGLSR